LWVIRPGDANETSQAWRVALEREDGPVALLLSRQGVETLDRAGLGAAEELERGGYVLWDSGDAAAAPELILISTGAEVPLTLAAARKLAGEGETKVRVVSMPCIELFEAQTQEYRDSVLPAQTTARLAVEPGASMSWWKWVGSGGDVLGIDRFGASAPGTRVLEELGFTVENIASRASALLERKG
jgi:transketolase